MLHRAYLALTVLAVTFPSSVLPQPSCPEELGAKIPPRPSDARGGTQFIDELALLPAGARESAIVAELLSGNIPAFMRQLVPVTLSGNAAGARRQSATICVMPDFLAIGSNDDFVRIPMDLHSRTLGFVLPTRKMVDAIHTQATYRFRPEPMTPGPQMSSPGYYKTHNSRIRAQRQSDNVPLGALVAGHKKTVVLTNRLRQRPGRIAIYGWLRRDGDAIQPLSTVHGADYADYSHGIRLVSETVVIAGERHSVYNVLQDRELAGILSREGVIDGIRELMQDNGG